MPAFAPDRLTPWASSTSAIATQIAIIATVTGAPPVRRPRSRPFVRSRTEPGRGPPAQSGHFMPTAAVRAQSGQIGVPHDEHERRVSLSGCQWQRASTISGSWSG